MKDEKTAGRNIKAFREKMGLTQDDLARYLNAQREIISYYETGAREIPIESLQKLADLFGVEMYDLMETDELVTKVNVALAFRANEITDEDLNSISSFRKIVKNYLQIQNLKKNNGLKL